MKPVHKTLGCCILFLLDDELFAPLARLAAISCAHMWRAILINNVKALGSALAARHILARMPTMMTCTDYWIISSGYAIRLRAVAECIGLHRSQRPHLASSADNASSPGIGLPALVGRTLCAGASGGTSMVGSEDSSSLELHSSMTSTSVFILDHHV